MTKYLVSFPAPAMNVFSKDMAAVGEAARAVIRETKDAGVYVFGGINEDITPLMVAADGSVTNETYPQTKEFDGGSASWNFRRAKWPSSGLRRSPKPVAALRNSANLGMTPKADGRGQQPKQNKHNLKTSSLATRVTPNPFIEGLHKRRRLLCNPHVKRWAS